MVSNSSKNRLWILRGAGIFLLVLTGYIILHTTRNDQPRNSGLSEEIFSTTDIYGMQGEWIDQDGLSVVLEDFRGKATVVSFVYLKCKMTCPRIVADLKKLDQDLNVSREKLRFVIFTFSDARNKNEDIQDFLKLYGIKDKHWRILTTSPENLKILADEFRLQYRVVDEKNL